MAIFMVISPLKASDKPRRNFQIWNPEKKQNIFGQIFYCILKLNRAVEASTYIKQAIPFMLRET
jgi:hypothetical protein